MNTNLGHVAHDALAELVDVLLATLPERDFGKLLATFATRVPRESHTHARMYRALQLALDAVPIGVSFTPTQTRAIRVARALHELLVRAAPTTEVRP